MAKRDFVNIYDINPEELRAIVDAAIEAKRNPSSLAGAMERKTLVMFFEKPSTRTRLSFETGMTQMGGHAIFFGKDSQLASGNEDLMDTAKVVSRYADMIMARVFRHETVYLLAKFATVPVINALCDIDHPCQALADVMTVKEKFGWGKGVKVAYVGDGNNVCNALMVACAMAGMRFAAACPAGYKPNEAYVKRAQGFGEVKIFDKPDDAASGADIVYTDTWVSMGQEAEKLKRMEAFKGYQVDYSIMDCAKPGARFMHCLPAHKGYEVAKEVIEGPQSIVYDQAENRLHAQKALMAWLLTAQKSDDSVR